MEHVIVDRITKSYEDKLAVEEIRFRVDQGELFGLIGPDGAGKTTLFRILTTLILPDAGDAYVNGHHVIKDFNKIRREVGYMPGKFSLYQDLTVEENLSFFASIFHTSIKENYDLIRDIYVQIEPFRDRRAGKLSGGMKQKLALCCALIHRPTVLFLDEPTTGVDAVSRREFWEMLKSLKAQGITILVSTPYMDEANLCEKIALIQDGKVMSIDTPAGIVSQFPDSLYALQRDDMSALLKELRSNEQIKTAYPFGEYHHVTFTKGSAGMDEFVRTLNEPLLIKSIEPTVEDCFIQLMSAHD